MHEFSTVDNGKSALMVTYVAQLFDISDEDGREEEKWLGNNGFVEIDLRTGKNLFEWWALDHIRPSETMVTPPAGPMTALAPWDFLYAFILITVNQAANHCVQPHQLGSQRLEW